MCISDTEAPRKTTYQSVSIESDVAQTLLQRCTGDTAMLFDASVELHLVEKTRRFKGKCNDVISVSLSPSLVLKVDFIGGFDSYGYQPPQKSSHLQLQPLYT